MMNMNIAMLRAIAPALNLKVIAELEKEINVRVKALEVSLEIARCFENGVEPSPELYQKAALAIEAVDN